MARSFVLVVLAMTVGACANDLSSGEPASAAPSNQPRDLHAAAARDDAAANDDAANDDAANDADDVVDDVPPAPAGPPPADAGQSCTEWTECGPWYVNDNSGFDCVSGSCVCNADDTYDEACAALNGVWSDADCFCYVGAAPMPDEDADEWVADDEDDAYDDGSNDDPRANRTCWWRWKETCEPDRWVDTGGYEYVCDGSGECDYEYEEDGYWESGDCNGYWIRRCDDGTEKRFG